jgi:hypothetical protein
MIDPASRCEENNGARFVRRETRRSRSGWRNTSLALGVEKEN